MDNSAQVVVPATNGNSQPTGSNSKSIVDARIQKVADKVAAAKMPEDLQEKAQAMVERLKVISGEGSFFVEFDNISRYIDWITRIPWAVSSDDNLDLNHARQVLDEHHYGLTEVKETIMEYLSIMIQQKKSGLATGDVISRAPIISLVGLAGVGKTTIASSIAEAMGRKFQRIPFGGMGAASLLRGQSRFSPEAEPGMMIKALTRAGTNNPVILLDEIDRVSENARADIMGVLIELLDPEQNKAFSDHYIDYPVNLSNVLFIATSNNTKDISTAVLDRLEVIQMPSYTDQEKIVIAKNYLLPSVLKESGLNANDIIVPDELWAEMVRPLGYDPGIRSLKRLIDGFVRRIVLYRLEGKIPQDKQFQLTHENVKMLVPAW